MAITRTKDTVDAGRAKEELQTALAVAGIVLPSLSVEVASPDLDLVQLGRIRSDVALKLAECIGRGVQR
ncbi:hypothetical protein AB0F13_09595 [Streptomyces sp. NPDC026206]|uniref:hypothetical protein n=1 Tax=Streptomyces sp. NPDC026206 TaxID=3157089 RepID=UPI0033C9DAAD